MVLNPRLKSMAERALPGILLKWLDPVRHLIDSEVAQSATELREGEIVLDAGAGEARHRNYFNRGRYVALDAGSGDPAWDYTRLDVRGDLEHIPVRDCVVDQVVCMVVLEHTRNPRAVLLEFARVLKRGGRLCMVVPFLWEEHQAPNDYHRFTRYGLESLFEGLPFRIDLLDPMGGFFWLAARRCINLLSFFQGGWRWLPFLLLAPFFGFIFPVLLYFLDGLDQAKSFSLGYRLRATREVKE